MRTRSKKPSQSRRKAIIVALIVLGVLATVLVILEVTNTTSIFHKKNTYQPPATINSETKGEGPAQTNGPSTNPSGTPDPQDGSWPSENKSPDAPTSNAKLVDPTGNFVSNHRPNLSGSPAPNTMQSSCMTTPGAMCQIIFTKGSTVKTLPAQTTDAGGGTYWTWKLQDVGITQGSWKVEAKATLGSQTKTAADALMLEVQE